MLQFQTSNFQQTGTADESFQQCAFTNTADERLFSPACNLSCLTMSLSGQMFFRHTTHGFFVVCSPLCLSGHHFSANLLLNTKILGPFISVRSFVLNKTCLPNKSSLTNVTGMWVFVRVPPPVLSKCPSRSEASLTDIAGAGRFASVQFFVSTQVVFPSKAFLTNIADTGIFAGVRSLMIQPMGFVEIALATDATHVGPFVRVQFFMLAEAAF